MPLQVVIADDEVLARQKLLRLLREEPDIEVVGEGANAAETIDLVHLTHPDVLLLDIRMPGMDGFDVISALTDSSGIDLPSIIFTTAHDQYALKAFEVHAADYLLKPFTRERLRIALEHAREQRERRRTSVTTRSSQKKEYTNRLVFRSKGRILFLPIAEIRWIGAEENYVRICAGKESHMLRNTMANFETKLDPEIFLRIHRSAIVNLQHVKEFRTDGNDGECFVTMSDGHKLPVSRGYRSRITSLIAR
ncbi:MAG TPA: LytTR family DNA-binding domain-containing protein [Acidobacteriaceae bacterium]|nr:LytTR family DNA-binding domain-containing protein [Acidobacteriaceae bacterium]